VSDELGAADIWLYSLLHGDAQLTAMLGKHPDSGECIYDALAPEGAALPYVVYQLQSPGVDTIAVGTIRIAANPLYVVRGVSASSFVEAGAIAARVDELLHGTRGQSAGGVVLTCYREQPLKLPPEVTAGKVTHYHQGGVYRIRARSA
jgi:hypothetical protein